MEFAKKIRSVLAKQQLPFGLILMVAVSISFFIVLAIGLRSFIRTQFLGHQQVIARAEATNIASFFQTFGGAVSVMAQSTSIKSKDQTTIIYMNNFIDQWRSGNLVRGVIQTDAAGVVRFNSNILGTHDLGVSLADRDFFIWGRSQTNEDSYFISEPALGRLGASKGLMIVSVASPVVIDKESRGLVAASVDLSALTKHYLEVMKVSDKTDVYLIDDNGGRILYDSTDSTKVNTSLFDDMPKLKDAIENADEGKIDMSNRLVSYSSVKLNNEKWFVVMASPTRVALDQLTPFYIRQASILLLFALSILFLGMIVSRVSGPQKRLE